MIICKFDQTEHNTIEDLHAHLRRFKIKQADYYMEYFPKKDLLTGEQIPFKNLEQYQNQDFINKNNLKKWLKQEPEEGKKWAINWLKKRKEEKKLIYAPSYAELKSLNGPTMTYFDTIGGYYNITKQLGFKERYLDIEPKIKSLKSDIKIIIDSREQLPLNIGIKTIEQKLDVGDYAFAEKNDNKIRIERKSLNDFVGTLNARKITRKKREADSALERFTRELNRAVENDLYVVMLVEATLNDALSFDYLPHMKWTKVTPSHVFKNLRDLLHKFPLNFQVVFVDGRIDAASKIVKILQLDEDIKRIDLQNIIEKGLL